MQIPHDMEMANDPRRTFDSVKFGLSDCGGPNDRHHVPCLSLDLSIYFHFILIHLFFACLTVNCPSTRLETN
jgi:hypothetical protein